MEKSLFNEMLAIENYHWWFVARRNIINAFIDKIGFDKNISIFEIGCGNGANLNFLSKHGQVTAVEKSETALNNAKNKNIGTILQGELPNNIPSRINQKFDLIIMLDVLEHIDEDEACLKLLHKYAAENGRLLLTVPAHQHLWSIHDEVHQHKRRYSIHQINELLINNGWKIKYTSFFNSFLFPLALFDRKFGSAPSKKNYKLNTPTTSLNWFFQQIFNLEQYLIGKISFPFGLSIITLAEHENN